MPHSRPSVSGDIPSSGQRSFPIKAWLLRTDGPGTRPLNEAARNLRDRGNGPRYGEVPPARRSLLAGSIGYFEGLRAPMAPSCKKFAILPAAFFTVAEIVQWVPPV